MSVGPRRRNNPIEEWGVRLGMLAGRSSGGGVTAEQRRIPTTSAVSSGSDGSGSVAVVQSETVHTSEGVWTSDPLMVSAGRPRVIMIRVLATGVTPGVVGLMGAGDQVMASAPVADNGTWAQIVPLVPSLPGAFQISIGWPSVETGTLVATILDLG